MDAPVDYIMTERLQDLPPMKAKKHQECSVPYVDLAPFVLPVGSGNDLEDSTREVDGD